MRSFAIAAMTAVLLLSVHTASAQEVPVPNAGFEEGAGTAPAGWTLSGGEGQWLDGGAAAGRRALAVTGDGKSSNLWLSDPVPFEPSRAFRLTFRARSIGQQGGTPIVGPGFANFDLGPIAAEWRPYSLVFFAPERIDPEASRIRLGQWEVKGTIAFDDVRVVRVDPIDRRAGDLVLGDGESIGGGEYLFEASLHQGADRARPLARQRCRFHSTRWWLDDGSEVAYRHEIGGRAQSKASVEVASIWHSGGEVAVEASGDGKAWRPLGAIGKVETRRFDVPADLLPSKEIWIRLLGRPAGGKGCSLQVGGYAYRATVDGPAASARGSTRLLEVEKTDPRFDVRVVDLGDGLPGGRNQVLARVANRTGEAIPIRVLASARISTDGISEISGVRIGAGEKDLALAYEVPDAGSWILRIAVGDFRATVPIEVAELYRSSYGIRLPGTASASLWWSSSGWKVSRLRPPPEAGDPNGALRIAAAGNEAEAAQLVLRPSRPLKGFSARASDLAGPGGAAIPASRIDILRVAYVEVTRPTDPTGCIGDWPDPLPPLKGAIDLKAEENQPLWIRVNVPKGQRAGEYEGRIEMAAEGWKAAVPLRVRVFGFDLPDRPTCTSAFGFSPHEVFRYQKVKDPARRREVLEKYWDDFAAHRISPSDPAPLDGFVTRWPSKEEIAAGKYAPGFEWARWDAAMTRALDGRGFTTFSLPVPGMGGGTFHSRVEPELLGFREGTKEYRALFDAWCRDVERHLREKGWLDRSYVYWFDEPDPKDYAFVMNGFRKLREAAPGIPRMLTEQPEEALFGGPNIWCPVTPEYRHEPAEKRRARGEKFWWYVCTGPKAPYTTLFIDHPATELRVWLWQTWARKIEGLLVWQTNYWTSSCAYPDRDRPQDPWRDPMSWVSGYDTPAGVRQPWGNGDGRFIYPPEGATGLQAGEILDGPVDSIRWEMLRDGVEDYEYMAILRRLLAERGDRLPAAEREAAAKLLEVPEEITKDMTTFARDPAPIERRREEVARAIERLLGSDPGRK
jgi:hypothetical protein